jgi:ribosomal protein S18 acetylase RimI-like enzyme
MPEPTAERLRAPKEPPYTTRPLDASTWDAFADLVEANNGIYGGCWCAGNHPEYRRGVSDPRTLKYELVHAGRAHAALVFDEDGHAQGWCQYGSPDELNLKHARAYRADPPPPARWRIACIFVDKTHRGQGIARVALQGALGQIAAGGGGLTEAISETTVGRQAQGRFLFSATVELFEHHGFTRRRQVGKHAWIVSRLVDPAPITTRRHTIDQSRRGRT